MPPAAVAEQRRDQLLEIVRQKGFASLPELAEALEVSESTIRRDLEQLEEMGTAKRTHGGAFYTGGTPRLPHFVDRQAAQWDKKKQIGHATAALVEDGDTLLLDGGSTTYEVAQRLVGRPIQVVTNSLPVANLFLSSTNTDLVLIGGYVHGRTGVALGQYANEMLARLNVRRTILSMAGINEQGYYNSNLLLVETERAMMQAADEVIVVADSTKFGHSSLARLAELSAVDRVVVDCQLCDEWKSRLAQAGVEVILAGEADRDATSTPREDGEPHTGTQPNVSST
jgi:DeoR family transcriptional regulator, fructose operon transcriptional repressor